MKIPNIGCSITIHASVNISEDAEKVKQAVSNVLPFDEINVKESFVSATSDDIASLEKIYETIHSKHFENIYRRNLEQNIDDRSNTSWFYLNKQAAFAGNIAICKEEDESPLGPIKVTLKSSNIERLIEWLVFGNNPN